MVDRAFRLQGLLNLRHLQEDQAAGRLAMANADLHDAKKELTKARDRLGAMQTSGHTNLSVTAAMRNAARMQIQEGMARQEYAQAVVDQRQDEWTGARRLSATLEKLENRHAEAVVADDLHKEQIVLDELASHMGGTGNATDGQNKSEHARKPGVSTPAAKSGNRDFAKGGQR